MKRRCFTDMRITGGLHDDEREEGADQERRDGQEAKRSAKTGREREGESLAMVAEGVIYPKKRVYPDIAEDAQVQRRQDELGSE